MTLGVRGLCTYYIYIYNHKRNYRIHKSLNYRLHKKYSVHACIYSVILYLYILLYIYIRQTEVHILSKHISVFVILYYMIVIGDAKVSSCKINKFVAVCIISWLVSHNIYIMYIILLYYRFQFSTQYISSLLYLPNALYSPLVE